MYILIDNYRKHTIKLYVYVKKNKTGWIRETIWYGLIKAFMVTFGTHTLYKYGHQDMTVFGYII